MFLKNYRKREKRPFKYNFHLSFKENVLIFVQCKCLFYNSHLKVGDKVKFCWRADIGLLKRVHDEGVLVITGVQHFPTESCCIDYIDKDGEESGCDGFWVDKIDQIPLLNIFS